jgi:PA14 domain-containing protein/GDSL-like lipase/acylhydrolase family protein
MRRMTRILLLPIFLVPILWVWPQRGITAAFYANTHWSDAPALLRVERQINLDFMTADSASLPQQEFSVEWSGWLRTDRDGEYSFSTRTDDGSTIEIDGHVVVDNGGVHLGTRRTATIAMTSGLHQIRVRFFQAAGLYEFHASWVPPGQKNPSAIPAQQLFVDKPPAVIVFLTRRVLSLWMLCWFALALVIAARIAKSARDIAGADLRRFALRLTLVLGTTVVSLLVAEGTVRLVHYLREDRRSLEVQLQSSRAQADSSMHDLDLGDIVQPSRDPGIVYELRPNVRGRFMGQPVLINSQGLHDYEYSRRKEPGTFRIVGVGDSSLFGWGVPFEDSGMKVLERRLNEKSRGQKFEVINFAVPGYNTAMEAETFVQRCLEYAPDLVLLNFNTNDYDVPNFMRRPRDLTTLRRSYVFDLAYSVYEGVMAVEREPPPFDFKYRTTALRQAEHLDEDPALPNEYRYMVGARGVVRALERLAAAARERAIPFVVFTVKAYPGLDPKYVRDEWRDGQRELLERESRRLGFHFLNTYSYYMNYLNHHPNANLATVFAVSEIDGHPNTLAHSIDAEAIFDYLVALQLLSLDKPSHHDH